jgi:hypothetical protein
MKLPNGAFGAKKRFEVLQAKATRPDYCSLGKRQSEELFVRTAGRCVIGHKG